MQEQLAQWPEDMAHLFSAHESIITPERRQQLWPQLLDGAMSVCDAFAWAIPDERALNVLGYFSPIVEVGAGAGALRLLSNSLGR